MKPRPFDYVRPDTVDERIRLGLQVTRVAEHLLDGVERNGPLAPGPAEVIQREVLAWVQGESEGEGAGGA